MTTRMLRLLFPALLWMTGSFNAYAGTVTYVYTDPQGTPLAEADASGNITARFEYTPYGVSVPSMGAAPNGVGYTGHVNDPETGLVYMQARYYDPGVGRFLSVDPVGVSAGNVFNINRYIYANANPISNIDPDGRVVRSANPANDAKLLQYINQRAGGKFEFKGGQLNYVGTASSGGKSSYYADGLVKAISSDRTLVLNIAAEHTGESGASYNVNDVGGGGITEARSNGDVLTTISGDGAYAPGVDGKSIYSGPADILMHEIVSHGVPLLGYPDTGNAITDDNKARQQIGLPLREANPDHLEGSPMLPLPPPPPSSCGLLCQK